MEHGGSPGREARCEENQKAGVGQGGGWEGGGWGREVKASLRGQLVSFKLMAGACRPSPHPNSSMEGILLAAPDMTGVWR